MKYLSIARVEKIKKKIFLQILVLITLNSNFNYKNQEKIFLKKSIKHMWQHQIHAIEFSLVRVKCNFFCFNQNPSE